MDLILPAGSAESTTSGADGSAGGHAEHADGAAGTAVGQRDYTYPMEQRAATLWYHDHRMDFTGPQVWRGLAGFHLVTTTRRTRCPCPAATGTSR